MKSMTLCLLDAGSSMGELLKNKSGQSFTKLSLSLGIVSSFITQRALTSKTAEFGVICSGTNITDNYLNKSLGSGYENITEIIQMGKWNINDMKGLVDISCSERNPNIIDSLIVSLDVLQRFNANKKYNRIMVLITDAKSKLKENDDDDEDLSLIENQILSSGVIIHVIIIGERKCSRSKVEEENIKFFLSLTKLTGGELLEAEELEDAYPFLACGLGMGTKPQNRKVVLEISPELRIPCVFWSKVKKMSLPSLKKRVGTKIGKVQTVLSESHTGTDHGLTIDRSYRNPLDPDEVLSVEDRVKGYKYGPHYVPMSFVDEAALKLPPSDPIVRLLGFVPMHKVARHHFLEGTVVLQAAGDQPSAHTALAAVTDAMVRLKQVALVRFVKSGSSDPVLAALVPPDDNNMVSPTCLYLHRLPVSEDCRDHGFPPLNDPRLAAPPSSLQRSAMGAFIDSATVDFRSPSQSAFGPRKRRVTAANQPYLSVLGEILRRLMDLEPTDARLLTSPSYACVALADMSDSQASKLLSSLRDAFPLKESEEDGERSGGGDVTGESRLGIRRKKRSYWSDIDIEVSVESRASVAENKEVAGVQVFPYNVHLIPIGVTPSILTGNRCIHTIAIAARDVNASGRFRGSRCLSWSGYSCSTADNEGDSGTPRNSGWNRRSLQERSGGYSGASVD